MYFDLIKVPAVLIDDACFVSASLEKKFGFIYVEKSNSVIVAHHNLTQL